MTNKLLPIALLLSVGISCSRSAQSYDHQGQKLLTVSVTDLDSIQVDAMNSSLRGNFFLTDSTIGFVDIMYCKLFTFNTDGDSAGTYLGRGQGPNELPGVMYGCLIEGDDRTIALIDNSLGWYEYDMTTDSVRYRGLPDFKWGEASGYDQPGYYKPMEMTDFALSYLSLGDDRVLIPLSLNNRMIGDITSQRYTDGKIFAVLDKKDMIISDIKGDYPDSFREHPVTGLEFFDFAYNPADSVIYVSFASDPLIYAYGTDGKIRYSFGMDGDGVNRDYTEGYLWPTESAQENIGKHVGLNTGLTYIPDDRMLMRTILTRFPDGNTILQGYRDGNLVLEQEMPSMFKLLGKSGDTYIGVRYLATDIDDETSVFTLYRFRLSDTTD